MAIRGEEAKNRFLNLLKDPVLLLIIVLIFAALAIFIVYPLFRVFAVSMTDKEGGFDLSAYSHAFSNRYMRQGFFNSLLVAGLTAIFGMLVGYLFAYTLNRTDIPLKGFFRTVAVLPIVFPPFIGALSIIMLFGFNG